MGTTRIGTTIAIEGEIDAQDEVQVLGSVVGKIRSGAKVELLPGSKMDGDIRAPRISIAEGADLKGSLDVERGGTGAVGHGR